MERLRLAGDQYNDVNSQLTDLRNRVASQDTMISELRNSLPPAVRIEHLARSNTDIQTALTSLASSTSDLGHTLTLAGGRYEVMVRPVTDITGRSS